VTKLSKPALFAVVFLAAQVSALGAELAVLTSGRSLRFDSKEQIGEVIRLYTNGAGYVDVPSSLIASFEHEAVPGPAQAPVSAIPAVATPPADLNQVVLDASVRHGIDPDFVRSVIKVESNFKPRAVSRKGAQGLMQLMPQTAAKLGVTDAFDPQANVEAGVTHLSYLLDLYHNDVIKALAAYNAGERRVDQYKGVPPYNETRRYVNNIVRDFNAKKRAQMKASQPASAKRAGTSTKLPPAAKPEPSAASPVGHPVLADRRLQ
jgi:hypothetical protein